jgi:hypothetical protein
MNDILLQRFYENEGERETVKTFMVKTLGELAIEKAFDGEDTGGIKEARECVERMFDALSERYGKITPAQINNSR